jgi:hypothetical protein
LPSSSWTSPAGAGEIDPFELSDRIHRFHDGIARHLYVQYRDLPPGHCVARATALHILERSEIPPEILTALESTIRFFAGEDG